MKIDNITGNVSNCTRQYSSFSIQYYVYNIYKQRLGYLQEISCI